MNGKDAVSPELEEEEEEEDGDDDATTTGSVSLFMTPPGIQLEDALFR